MKGIGQSLFGLISCCLIHFLLVSFMTMSCNTRETSCCVQHDSIDINLLNSYISDSNYKVGLSMCDSILNLSKYLEDKNMIHRTKAKIYENNYDYNKALQEYQYVEDFNGKLNQINCLIRLKKINQAQVLINSIPDAYYFKDYVVGNFYEVIGQKKMALTQYRKLISSKWMNHEQAIPYDSLKQRVQNRILELNRKDSKPLSDIQILTLYK